jgi:ketosteroid isomerase-like protein
MLALAGVLATSGGCSGASARPLGGEERAAITNTIEHRIMDACDLSKPDVVARMMSLYPDSGPVISAAAGRVTTSRAALEGSIREFWNNVGRNMRDPVWEWEDMHVTVLAPDAAVLTATYRIPHKTPRGDPHVVGGAWTAVFQKQPKGWVIVQEHLSDRPAPSP